jgi:hypothetical protein
LNFFSIFISRKTQHAHENQGMKAYKGHLPVEENIRLRQIAETSPSTNIKSQSRTIRGRVKSLMKWAIKPRLFDAIEVLVKVPSR